MTLPPAHRPWKVYREVLRGIAECVSTAKVKQTFLVFQRSGKAPFSFSEEKAISPRFVPCGPAFNGQAGRLELLVTLLARSSGSRQQAASRSS